MSKPYLDLGNNLEAVVLRLLAIRTGRIVEAAEPFKLVRHPEHEWLFCTPDGWERERFNELVHCNMPPARGIVQAKTAFAMNKHEWDIGPPDYYQVQIQHEMLASGCTWGTLAVLFIDQGVLTRLLNAALSTSIDIEAATEITTEQILSIWNSVSSSAPEQVILAVKQMDRQQQKALIREAMRGRVPEFIQALVRKPNMAEAIEDACDFRYYDIEADAEFQAALLEAEKAFIDLTDTGTPPSTDASESCRRAIQRLHPKDNGAKIVLPQEFIGHAMMLDECNRKIKEQEQMKCEIENRIKVAMGDATYAVLPDGSRFKWATQNVNAETEPRKAYTKRVLTFQKAKDGR